ncbi:MAG: STAS domain-containing protein [Spirochaetes bacterium]|nr:STAS domain-containing protein [Spirochaetota bacterium]
MATDINYSIIDNEGIKVVRIVGNISNSNRKEFELLVKRLSERHHVILNMQEVEVITSAGFDSLVNISRFARSGKWKLMLMGVREEVKKRLEEMEIRQNFVLIDSMEEGQTRIHYY